MLTVAADTWLESAESGKFLGGQQRDPYTVTDVILKYASPDPLPIVRTNADLEFTFQRS